MSVRDSAKNSAVVLGAGINGVVTAYFLAKAGMKVTVLEKGPEAGVGCSYGNGGQLSFSHNQPFFASLPVLSILKAAFWNGSLPNLANFKDRDFLIWLKKIIVNSRQKEADKITSELFTVGLNSKLQLAEILEDEEINFHHKEKGILHFYRDTKALQEAVKQAEFQESMGCKIEILSPKKCVLKEPTLVKLFDENHLAGGILFGADASGDCHEFIQNLAQICREKYKVNFEYNTEVRNLLTNRQKITGINTNRGVFVGGHYICALGSYGGPLLRGIGVDLGIYPVKGYSLSIPANSNFLAPNHAMTDPVKKIVYSRLGSTFRAGGTFEFCNLKTKINHKNIEFLKNAIRSTFSDFGNLNKAEEWCGFRPYLPGSVPIASKVEKYGNLYINSGHGSLGWTSSFATSKFIADSIVTERPDQQLATILKNSATQIRTLSF